MHDRTRLGSSRRVAEICRIEERDRAPAPGTCLIAELAQARVAATCQTAGQVRVQAPESESRGRSGPRRQSDKYRNSPSSTNRSAFGGAGSGMSGSQARASSSRGSSSMGGSRGGGGGASRRWWRRAEVGMQIMMSEENMKSRLSSFSHSDCSLHRPRTRFVRVLCRLVPRHSRSPRRNRQRKLRKHSTLHSRLPRL